MFQLKNVNDFLVCFCPIISCVVFEFCVLVFIVKCFFAWLHRVSFKLNRFTKMSRSCTWVFTLNNYEDSDIERLTHLDADKYFCIFGEEVGEQGTPHLQGYIRCENRLRRSNVEKVLGGRAWLEVTHDEEAAIGYAIKDGVVHSNEQLPEGFGGRVLIVRKVCEEMGMKKYLYHEIGHLPFEGRETWDTEEEARVCSGYLAYLEGIHWYDKSTWKK